jgi:hypothetical protein
VKKALCFVAGAAVGIAAYATFDNWINGLPATRGFGIDAVAADGEIVMMHRDVDVMERRTYSILKTAHVTRAEYHVLTNVFLRMK